MRKQELSVKRRERLYADRRLRISESDDYGRNRTDIVFVKEVLGVKLAISDHRAPNVTEDELIQIASKARWPVCSVASRAW